MTDECGRTHYRGCSYRKVFEVFDAQDEVIGHAFFAKEARAMIDNDLRKRSKKEG